MTEQEILALNLSNEEKTVIRNSFQYASQFSDNRQSVFSGCTTEEQVREVLASKAKAKAQQVERDRKKYEKLKLQQDGQNAVLQATDKAINLGLTYEDVVNIIMSHIKAKHNEALEKQIEELKAQMI